MKFTIQNREINNFLKPYIIAEACINHEGVFETAEKMIISAKESGVDCVKFQIYDPEEAFSKKETTKDVKLNHLYGLKPWWEVARDKILMPREWFGEMFVYARKKKLIPLQWVKL